MKALLITGLVLIFSIPLLAEDWTTTDGKSYQDVKVVRVEPDAITIIYKDGGALVPLFKLSPPLQQRFSYDPIKAKEAADKRAKDDVLNAAALQHEIDLAAKLKLQEQIRDAAMKTATPPKTQ